MDLWKICRKMVIATNYHHYYQLLADCRVSKSGSPGSSTGWSPASRCPASGVDIACFSKQTPLRGRQASSLGELSCKGIRLIVSLGISPGFWHMKGLLHISSVWAGPNFWRLFEGALRGTDGEINDQNSNADQADHGVKYPSHSGRNGENGCQRCRSDHEPFH